MQRVNAVHNLVVKGVCTVELVSIPQKPPRSGQAFVETCSMGSPSRGRRGRSDENMEGRAALFSRAFF